MALLWYVAQTQVEAAWTNQGKDHPDGKPIPARQAGFKGYVQVHDTDDDTGGHHQDGWDEDLYDQATPEPTAAEDAHLDEHGEYPEHFYHRHDVAYQNLLNAKQAEEKPDHEDYRVGHFVSEHAHDADWWHEQGKGPERVDLTRGAWATQTHVHSGHIQRYLGDPQDAVHNPSHYYENPSDDHPIFASHQGRLHVIDGHHRVAAALQRGDTSITGFHADLHKVSMPDYDDWN